MHDRTALSTFASYSPHFASPGSAEFRRNAPLQRLDVRPSATILLIDSDADSIAIYSMILDHYGYKVMHANDGSSGLQLAQEVRPSLIVTELFLPQMDGSMVAVRLRADPRTAQIPLIVLDSVPTLSTALLANVTGAIRLTKPCEPSRLLHEVERMLAPTPFSPS